MPQRLPDLLSSNSSYSQIEQNTRLAQQLIMHLRNAQQRNGSWPGRNMGHALRYTCQSLEALQMLGGQVFTRTISNGSHWILNLSDEIDEGSDDRLTVRLHPSRFKTLAKLKEFDDEKLIDDFSELCKKVDGEGHLQKVLEDPLLGSMIIVDCLLELGASTNAFGFFERIMSTALPAIETGLRRWCQADHSLQNWGLVDNVGEASYAMDLLLRSRHITLDYDLCAPVRQAMLDALSYDRNQRMLGKDALYSAIQLSQYFGEDPCTSGAINQFQQHLCSRYEQNDIQRWVKQEDIQPLVLRMLLSCGGRDLIDHLTSRLWEDAYASQQQLDIEKRSERNRHFERIIRHRTNIDIRNVQELTGGITKAKVFRIEYVIHEDVITDPGLLRRSGSTRIVIKSDERNGLERSIARYRSLPAEIQKYFARHALTTEIHDPLSFAPAYMVLEDLTEEYVTLREILDDVDKRRLSPDDRERWAQAISAITKGLFDIYSQTCQPGDDVAGFQISRLYLSRLDRSLLEMASHNRFPKLKDFFRGFTLIDSSGTHEHFKSIGYYQQEIYRHLYRLRPPCLVMMHGDCHSRNIMVDNCFERVKFIDLDKIDVSGDYLLDAALLIEDVALFRRYFDDKYRFYLRPEDIRLDPGETNISYPTRVTETAIIFQQAIMEQVASFAQTCNDHHYRERLWLGIALHLLRLVEKQADLRMAVSLYAEAIKLLDALVDHLNDRRSLPQLPIEQYVVPKKAVAEHLQIVHAIVANMSMPDGGKIRYELRANGAVVRYFTGNTETPFAIIDGKAATTRFMLACPSEMLMDAGIHVQPISEGLFQSVAVLDGKSGETGAIVERIASVVLDYALSTALNKTENQIDIPNNSD